MKIIFHREFKKSLKRLPERLQAKTGDAIRRFVNNSQDPALRNHALSGRMQGLRSISVTGSYRIIFEELESGILVILLDIGSHEQIYQ